MTRYDTCDHCGAPATTDDVDGNRACDPCAEEWNRPRAWRQRRLRGFRGPIVPRARSCARFYQDNQGLCHNCGRREENHR